MTAARDHDAIVRRAWCETLEVAACTGSWAEAGGDSLATLHLVYRLEQLLGRALDFELFAPDMTATAMAAALDRPAPAHAAGAAPPVFLLPGVLGDGPSLANFRHRLAGEVRFELLAEQGAADAAAILSDVAASARRAVAHIVARQPTGPVRLAGYSFGGSIALEAAAQLVDAGREVAQVAVFDSAFGDAVLGPSRLRWRGRWRRRAARLLTPLMAWDAGRRTTLAAVDRLAPSRGPALRRFVLRRFRTDARLAWRPRPLAVPIFLALSDEFAPVMGPVWQRLYPHAAVTRVPATHYGLFRDAALDIVAAAFAASLTADAPPAALARRA